MKRILTLLFCLAIFAGANAQWQLYDASKLPSETAGDELDLTKLSQDSPGPNFIEAIMPDPDIQGNSLLQYIQPDDDATKMYRSDLKDAEGNAWGGSRMTMVARIKGVPNAGDLGLDRIFDLQWRIANVDKRDELRIFYDGRVELEKSDTTYQYEGDLTEWHIFRIAIDGGTATVYIDEDDTPVAVGESTSGTGDLYIKIGDGSGDHIGGYVDWVAVETSGAFSPSEKPLDERFTGNNSFRGTIAFISSQTNDNDVLEEAGLITDLRRRGYFVDVHYPTNDGFTYEAMNAYDVVIIGRGVSSGDFRDDAVQGWESVTSPVIIFSAYLMRNSRLKISNAGTASRENDDGNAVDKERVTNVEIVDHPVFTGVTPDMNNQIPYLTWFYDYLVLAADTFEMTHSGTLLATLVDEGGPGDGTVYMAYWEAGNETYAGSEVTPAGPRMYMQMGSDDKNSPKILNFTAFTDESLTVLYNSIDWLSGKVPTGVLPDIVEPLAHWSFSEGTGTTVADRIGGANFEVLNGNGMTWESCGVGTSMNFAGTTKDEAILQAPSHPNLNFDSTQSWSISMLVKADPFDNTAEMTLFMKGDNGMALPDGMGRWYAIATKDQQLRLAVDDAVVKTQLDVDLTEEMWPVGQWNHVVGVRDLAEDSLKLYLNGVLVGSIEDGTDLDISTDNLPIMVGNYHSGVRKLNGSVDEIMVYDVAMTAGMVADLFANTSTTNNCEVLETISELSDDASLASLEVSAGELTPVFDPVVTTYSLVLPEGSTSVVFTATANNENATVAGDGEFTDVPGTAVITVTAEDGSTQDYTINISVEGIGNKRIFVEPGFGNISLAIEEAVSGDTLVLQNGGLYNQIDPYAISKKLVIIAEEIPALPGLANQPVIENIFLADPIFDLQAGADLHLIGIDVDAQGAMNIFNAEGEGRSFALYVTRCKLHNTSDDLFNDARDGNIDMSTPTSIVVRNSFIYDTGLGHGFYVRDYTGSNSDYVFDNITYWNMGQQFNWIRHYAEGDQQAFIYNHMTGYNLSSAVSENKELFGNSDNLTEATLTIDVGNSIFSTQLTTEAEASLWFDNTTGRHTINLHDLVLYEVRPVVDRGGTTNKDNIQEGVDPMFVDPDNGDFTVMNAALYGAADDGEIIGATYWHPDFVDDFSDLSTSANDVLVQQFKLDAYPNPFSNEVIVNFELESPSRVELRIYDLNGQLIDMPLNENRLASTHKVQINTTHLKPGIYIYQLRTNGKIISSKMIKTQ